MFLDTTFCIDVMREQHRRIEGPATRKLIDLAQTPLYAAVFVICELHAGARLSRHPRRELRRVQLFSERVQVMYPGPTFAVSYGEAEADLRGQAVPVPTMDLLIGLIAKTSGLPLLTRDPGHFARIRGLVVETY